MTRPPRVALTAVVVAVVLAGVGTAGAIHAPPSDHTPASEQPLAVASTPALEHGPAVGELSTTDATGPNESNASLSIWRIPHTVDAENASVSEVRASEGADAVGDDGTGDPDPIPVTPADRVAIAIHVPGLDARVANASGNDTERVLEALGTDGFFAVRQTIETTQPELQQATLWLNASNVRALDAGDDRYVLVVDPTATLAARVGLFEDDIGAVYQDPDNDYRFDSLYEEPHPSHEAFAANYFVNRSTKGRVAQTVSVRFNPAAIDVTVDGPLAPEANATITGRSTLAPGTPIEVTVKNQTDAVVASASTTVTADGTFEASVDLSTARTPANLSVTAVAADYPGDVSVDPGNAALRDPVASIAFADQRSSTQFVSVRADLSHGGVLVLRNETTVLDTTTTLKPGHNQTATLSLPPGAANGTYRVVAYRGTAEDRAAQYPDGTASARIEFTPDDADVTTTDPTTTQTTAAQTTAPTDDGTTAATSDATTDADDGPIPGFGTVTAVAALLVGTAALAVRRRRR